jgi:lipopolysaccharide transport protein LptA
VLAAAPLAHGQEVAARRTASDLGMLIDPSKPMQIVAEEFEVQRGDHGGDLITFSRNVRATQDGLRLTCDWLEALYPPEGGNAQRITARGSVQLEQPGTTITCTELLYDSPACRVLCTSDPAVVIRGEDVLKGQEIELDLCKGTLTVRGGAALQLRPSPKPAAEAAEESETGG